MQVHSILRSNNVTLSGDLAVGGVEIKDRDSDVRAEVTAAGLAIHNRTPSVAGNAVQIAIDATERRLDLTPLVGAMGYPMDVELEARDNSCYIRQGGSAVSLAGVNGRILDDEWRVVTVSGIDMAYIAVQRASATVSGTLVGMRIDTL